MPHPLRLIHIGIWSTLCSLGYLFPFGGTTVLAGLILIAASSRFSPGARVAASATVAIAMTGIAIGASIPLNDTCQLVLPALFTYAVLVVGGLAVWHASDPERRHPNEWRAYMILSSIGFAGFMSAVWQGNWERVSLQTTPVGLVVTIAMAPFALFLAGLLAHARPPGRLVLGKPVLGAPLRDGAPPPGPSTGPAA